MPSSGPVRRVLAVTAAFGLAVGIAALPGGAADAAVHTQFQAGADTSASYTGSVSGPTCSLSSGTATKSSPTQVFTGGTHHIAIGTSATYTLSTNSSDKVSISAHVSTTLAVGKAGKDLKSFRLASSGGVSIANALGGSSQCQGSGEALGDASISFSEHSAGWLTVTHAGDSSSGAVIVIVNTATNQLVTLDLSQGGTSKATGTAFLAKGQYVIEEMANGFFGGNAAILKTADGTRRSVSQTATITGSFVKAGAASGSTSGSAKRYVAFPTSVNCTAASASMQWTGAAGKAKSGVFLVNGKQKGSTQSPFPGEKVVLKNVPSSSATKIVAKVKLKSGSTVTASRSYYACKG